MRSPKPKTITCNEWDFNHPPIFFAALRWTNSVVKDWTWKVGDCEFFYSIVSFSLSIVSLRGNKLKWPKEIWTTNSFLIPWRQSKWVFTACHTGIRLFFSLKFGCPARALDWRILQQICFRTACDCADKKNTSSAGFASNIFESMMQILTRQNLHAKDKCMLELPPWLINMQRISTFKTTKEPPQDGFGAWCVSWKCWFLGSYAGFSQASTTLIHHRSSEVPVMGIPQYRTLATAVWKDLRGLARCIEVRFQRWSTSWANLQLQGRWPILRLYVPDFRPSGNKVPQSQPSNHCLSVFPPTHFEVPDPWQFCAGVCHPKENFAALVDSCCWRDSCFALFMS